MKGRKTDIDFTGQTINELFVIGASEQRKGRCPAWDCKCSCGKICLFTTYELRSGRAKSCGHLRGQSRTLNLTGKKFFDLTVLYKVPNKRVRPGKYGKTYWHCLCTCGEECDVQTSDLTMGKRKDCGHSHDEYMHQIRTKDIVGNVYSYLEVTEMLPSVKINNKWRAMCRAKCLLCGNVIDIQKNYLISGDTKSCGCLKSVGERAILNYLIEHKIPYKRQYYFDDLKTDKDGICWFDFGILNDDKSLKFLIEYQGRQHYEELPGPWNFGQYAREVTDPLKRKYCAERNIQLYEIKYDADITEELNKIFACQSCAKSA